MGKFNSWVNAARLRTLPLSISGILVGTVLAAYQGYFNIAVFSLALGTTLGLQILSNFANDYGDGMKGTDNENRVGPARALPVSYTHLRAHETKANLVCRLLLE